MCLRERTLVRPATVVDHVTPHGGDWNKFLLGELQSLCEHCHNSDKKLEELGKPRQRIGVDGWSDSDRPSRVDAPTLPIRNDSVRSARADGHRLPSGLSFD
jgi:hypothetical protein